MKPFQGILSRIEEKNRENSVKYAQQQKPNFMATPLLYCWHATETMEMRAEASSGCSSVRMETARDTGFTQHKSCNAVDASRVVEPLMNNHVALLFAPTAQTRRCKRVAFSASKKTSRARNSVRGQRILGSVAVFSSVATFESEPK